jgi:hypothetical protein
MWKGTKRSYRTRRLDDLHRGEDVHREGITRKSLLQYRRLVANLTTSVTRRLRTRNLPTMLMTARGPFVGSVACREKLIYRRTRSQRAEEQDSERL